MNSIISLEWLAKLHLARPESKVNRNIFDISGYPNWENVNSNVVAFFLDENEEHQFKRLFFDSLLELYHENLAKQYDDEAPNNKMDLTLFVDSAYQVTRETNRIDILLKADNGNQQKSEWAILIENKLDHVLNNDFKKYCNSIEAKKKYGITLTKFPPKEKIVVESNDQVIEFINITHEQLSDKVESSFGAYFFEASERHTFFLKEYISNIKSYYKMSKPMPSVEQNLKTIQANKREVVELEQAVISAKTYVQQVVTQVLGNHGFQPVTPYASIGKHFYAKDKDGNKLPLRIYLEFNPILYNNEIAPVIELYDEYCVVGAQVLNRLNDSLVTSKFPRIERDDKNNNSWVHLGQFCTSIVNYDNNLFKAIETAFSPFFYKADDKSESFYEIALNITLQELDKLKKGLDKSTTNAN